MRRDDLAYVTVDGRHAGELIAHPCACGHLMCTLGTHIWQSTADMASGPKAQSFEPPTARGVVIPIDGNSDGDAPPDRTDSAHDEYKRLLAGYHSAARALVRFIDAHRPDRWAPLPEPATDDQWCRNHLEAGYCEPRYRGDLCRFCYDLGLTYGVVPDKDFMELRHNRGYFDDRDIKAWRDRMPKTKGKKTKSKMASYG